MRLGVAIWLAVMAGTVPALAQPPLSAAEFEAEVTGQTLRYAWDGQPWGAEQYLPGRRVIWKPVAGQCSYGRWYEETPGEICFLYGDKAPICWQFSKGAAGLEVQSFPDPIAAQLTEAGRSDQPLTCPGPEVGV